MPPVDTQWKVVTEVQTIILVSRIPLWDTYVEKAEILDAPLTRHLAAERDGIVRG